MLTIRLFCAAGMSTSLLVNKMIEEAKKEGKEVDIVAYPVNELDRRLAGVDVALLGPQVGYLKKKAQKTAADAGVPLDVIPMADYGRCNGKAVLNSLRNWRKNKVLKQKNRKGK
ncbi:PTS sugar transporter subunit IIB [Dubosiella newyorkensis]|uniref:PTS sugar transporter subunit IIB n=2 Tax=Dubosiella newyorkensis TaxID=1862672 RepID=UPI002730AECD|nr:PTS sugar transporter subunit IIB [Dubosiella newyorkensis]